MGLGTRKYLGMRVQIIFIGGANGAAGFSIRQLSVGQAEYGSFGRAEEKIEAKGPPCSSAADAAASLLLLLRFLPLVAMTKKDGDFSNLEYL